MTYELNLNCIWQHPTTGNHLEITKNVWGEVQKPIIISQKSTTSSARNLKNTYQTRHRRLDQPPVVSGRFHQVSLLCSSSPITKPSGERTHSLLSVTNSRQRTIQFKTSEDYLLELQLSLENPNWHFFDDPVLVRRPFLTIRF